MPRKYAIRCRTDDGKPYSKWIKDQGITDVNATTYEEIKWTNSFGSRQLFPNIGAARRFMRMHNLDTNYNAYLEAV